MRLCIAQSANIRVTRRRSDLVSPPRPPPREAEVLTMVVPYQLRFREWSAAFEVMPLGVPSRLAAHWLYIAGCKHTKRKRPRPNRPRAFTFSGARDRARTGDPHVGKRRRTRGTATTYALGTGISRHRAAYRGTWDGSQHRKRHPRGTRFGRAGVWAHPPPPMEVGLLCLVQPKNKKGAWLVGFVSEHAAGRAHQGAPFPRRASAKLASGLIDAKWATRDPIAYWQPALRP
jgi:hypothetical protein